MGRHVRFSGVLLLGALSLASTCSAAPYFQQQEKPAQKPSDKEKAKEANKGKDTKGSKDTEQTKAAEASPFGAKKVNMLKSSQRSDSASMGFNGVGPTGEIEEERLAEEYTAADELKAQQVYATTAVEPPQLAAFIQEGQLNAAGPHPSNLKEEKK